MRNNLLVAILAIATGAGGLGTAIAQIAPSAAEVRAYTGLHAAAATDDVANIAKLAASDRAESCQD